jgi:hypothetical protein
MSGDLKHVLSPKLVQTLCPRASSRASAQSTASELAT